jgi:uracil-DNA glycosylase family 4
LPAVRSFDVNCKRCPRLAEHLAELRELYPDYWNRPVPSFGADRPEILIVGLAPGRHGANASGRPFTGDFAGILLYQTLFDLGLASAPVSTSADDALALRHCRITNAVKCLPPQNKPTTAEIATCNGFLRAELESLSSVSVIVALGAIAHKAVLKAFDRKLSAFPFAHGAEHALSDGLVLIDSYHCSRYNTQTRRLTPTMFRAVLETAKGLALTAS